MVTDYTGHRLTLLPVREISLEAYSMQINPDTILLNPDDKNDQ